MKKSDFYFDLPQELIAQTPLEQRDASRLLHLNKTSGELEHRHFYDLPEYLHAGDCLVMNDSRVLPARLFGHRPTGGSVEVVLLRDLGQGNWECLTRPGRKTPPGTHISFGEGELSAEVISAAEDGNKILHFNYEGIFLEILEHLGHMPLPPYIKEELQDAERYQTVYSREVGSAAAPTAGLHFTPEIFAALEAKGVKRVAVTLHVGPGTFRPVKADNIEDHQMDYEAFSVSPEAAEAINACKARGGRVFCVGSTTVRTLETVAAGLEDVKSKSEKVKSVEDNVVVPGTGASNIFIYPPYRFRVCDCMLTNFHLPQSTLIMMVSALAGRERVLCAYAMAVQKNYMFFSYGDCMLIV